MMATTYVVTNTKKEPFTDSRVRKALAMAQPNGALIDYASQHDKVVAMENEHSLVIDPGSRTFDWLVARGMKLSHKRSHSVNRGVSDILQVIADDISAEIGKPYLKPIRLLVLGALVALLAQRGLPIMVVVAAVLVE